ncbi:hypothetical protein SASPL_149596 [Salvia splendens]|uniref:Pentatricopeptide repeat-containing protein n=1 Tax=Salvia splendens TaxID=180675 RepID=A0A8X8WC12_SALSN|nr:hypothetical protein SASPL_149596 [Salvia splendens]
MMEVKDVVSWTTMRDIEIEAEWGLGGGGKAVRGDGSFITGHLGVEDFDEAFEVFHRMILCGEQPSKSSFSSCDIFVDTALLDMYAKSGEITSSVEIFNRMKNKNDVVWAAMIQGLAENGFAEESLQCFEEMGNA